jgi:hypothetical protein
MGVHEVAAEKILAALLARNEELGPLCEEVLRRASKQKLVDNLRRLLKGYYLDLRPRAVSNLENAATNLLKSRYGRVRICAELSDILAPEKEQETEDKIIDNLDKKADLEKWIAGNPGLAIDSAPLEKGEYLGEDDEILSEAGDEMEENTDKPLVNIAKVEAFLLGGEPFRNLSTSLRMFLLPASLSSLTRTLMAIPADCIWFSKGNDNSISSRIKTFMEDITEDNWDWWPLRPTMRCLKRDRNGCTGYA